MWCIQTIDSEFRERMYHILNLYEEDYDPKKPLICLDEKPKQLLRDKRMTIPMEPGKSGMYDYEYRQSYMDRSKKTQEFFQNNKHWLKILYFPPATPDRNPAEYCWKATREGLTSIKSFKI